MTPERHPSEHEDWLLTLVTGESDPRAALARSEEADCVVCRSRMDELLEVAELLDGAGRDARATLATAEALASAPGEERVAAVLAESFRASAPAVEPPIARGLRRAALVLAMAAAAAFLLFFLQPDEPAEPRGVLGANQWELVEPVGRAPFGEFEWRGPDLVGARFLLSVTGDGRALADVELTSRTWHPDDVSGWPDRISWQLTILDASGAVVDTLSASASR